MTAVDRPAGDLDEFDLDLVFGELDPLSGGQLYLPSRREVPGETCDTHEGTCPHTQCPNTCAATCPNTCQQTCGNTCPATCAATCDCETRHPCPTELQTHCFTCRCRQ